MPSETAPLLSNSNNNEPSYYFLNSDENNSGAIFHETIPQGATADEFAPRVLNGRTNKTPKPSTTIGTEGRPPSSGGFWSNLFGRSKQRPTPSQQQKQEHHIVKPRKVPIKIEPKVFFANERTFLAWMHMAILLAGASVAIMAFADHDERPGTQLYGVVLLPVSMAFIVYSMYQYARRSRMIRLRHPGPYDDTAGPTVLGIMLMLSIVAQFAIKIYSLHS